MEKLQSRQQIGRFTLLVSALYMVSYIARINFGAIVAEMERSTGISRSLLSMSLTGSFITFGTGQIFGGIMGDRISPKRMVTYGLIVTTAMNFLLPLCQNAYQMLFVWCMNGFGQAFMWPPVVRLMSAMLSEDDYKKSVSKVVFASSVGTILVYLLSPVIITATNWKGVFLFSGLCSGVMLIIWRCFAVEIQTEPPVKTENSRKPNCSGTFLTPMIFCVLLAIVFHGMLRDGITTWMPSYIAETYHLGSAVSILTGVVLPIFSIICVELATTLYRKWLKNPMLCAGVMFAAGSICALAMYLLADRSAIASVVLSAGLTGFMSGVNLILVCMLPSWFQKYGTISTVAGAFSASTYIGSAVSTYGIAALSETAGWNTTIFLWFLIAAAGSGICLCCTKPWNKKFSD